MLPVHFEEIEDEDWVKAPGYDIPVSVKRLGDLDVPTGALIGCDPLHQIETEPFDTRLPEGSYPLDIYIAHLRDEPMVAYAALQLKEQQAVEWNRACLVGDEEFDDGYATESDVGCFVDEEVASYLMQYRHHTRLEDDDFRRHLASRVRNRREDGCGWAEIRLARDLELPVAPEMNIFAFDAGDGEGVYESWMGLDQNGGVVSVVTDFDVLECRFRRFPGEV
jgi:hypothetical protein